MKVLLSSSFRAAIRPASKIHARVVAKFEQLKHEADQVVEAVSQLNELDAFLLVTHNFEDVVGGADHLRCRWFRAFVSYRVVFADLELEFWRLLFVALC